MASWGGKKYRNSLNEMQQASADYIVPYLNAAVKQAENNPRNFGVLSESISGPASADRVLNNSIFNNFSRWIGSGTPGKFVDFMQKRWAPIGVANDPRNLNRNWAPNVRSALENMLGQDEYERWKRYNMVRVNDQENQPWIA